MTQKIASWNVNSIKMRKDHVLRWLAAHSPDILMIQELKGVDFPDEDFKGAGYQAHAVTQKAYNGVAILSKEPATLVLNHLPGDETDDQARYLEVDYNGLRVINIYMPNGNPVNAESEKFPYKLKWMERLYKRLKELRDKRISFVIGGDFNVIPTAQDCYDPKAWDGDALYHPDTLKAWHKLLNLGLYDAFRIINKTPNLYTFWDYQAGAWPQNKGIRIDHFLLSPPLVDKLVNCEIDQAPRGEEKASDHTPIILELA